MKTYSVTDERLKFPGCCQDSLNCHGCQSMIHEYDFDQSKLIHNQDIIKVRVPLDTSNLNIYYELQSSYEESEIFQSDQSRVPCQHVISIEKYENFSEVEDKLGSYACGGVNFVVYSHNQKLNQSKVICANGWKGQIEGWNESENCWDEMED